MSNIGVTLQSGSERSLKVIENGTIQKRWHGFLFAFCINYGRILSRFGTIHERDRQTDTTRRQTAFAYVHAEIRRVNSQSIDT